MSQCHSVDNFSDHSPLIMSSEVTTHHEWSDPVCRSDMIPQCNWDMTPTENISLYKIELDKLLHDLDVPWEAIKCKHINSRVHTTEIDRYHKALIQCCMLASKKSIPSAGKAVNNTKKAQIGWNDYISEKKRDKAIFWHKIWQANGAPRHDATADIRKKCIRGSGKLTTNRIYDSIGPKHVKGQ